MSHLVLVTGLPGSGKSTFAKRAYPTYELLETDQLFMENGEYKFDASKLSEYHNKTQQRCKELLEQGKNVVVANTFSRKWEMNAYTNMPFSNLTVYYMEPPGGHCYSAMVKLAERNVHRVPYKVIDAMWTRWEHKEGEYVVGA